MSVPTFPYTEYYYAAYAASMLIYAGYAVSLFRRARAVRDRMTPR